VSSHAYRSALEKLGIVAIEKACPLFVPLVEEGWTDHPVTEQVARIYLDDLGRGQQAANGKSVDVLVLGCTHYPLLKPLLRRVLPPDMQLVDSAQATAQDLAERLTSKGSPSPTSRKVQFFATDSVEKFRALGSRFLEMPIDSVELVTLPE
jgi:glutamate racemase